MSYNILSKGTNVSNYCDWVEKYTNKTFSEMLNNKDESIEDDVFLSIVTRTQGKRPEALAETLLCLTAQTDMDFELLILGHNLNENQKELVENIIDNLPMELHDRTKLIEVKGGTRTTPLNVGFENAKGSYIAILDDDDIVFDNWVESFKLAAKNAPGAILHAYSLSQKWMAVRINSEIDALRAVAAHTDEFCTKFDWINEINLNTCPPVGLAFPKYAFKELGIKFDETLNTTEDWDFLMRTAFATGITDIEEPTCIYRLWQNAENSQTLHSPEEWKKNHLKIIEKFHSIPLLLPIGYTRKLIWNDNSENATNVVESNRKVVGRLYYDKGKGFSTNDSIAVEYNDDELFNLEIILNSNIENAKYFRWDPRDDGDFNISKLDIVLVDEIGEEEKIDNKNVMCNGFKVDDKFIFIMTDPQLIFKSNTTPVKIKLSGRINKNTDSEYSQILKKKADFKLKMFKLKQKLFAK